MPKFSEIFDSEFLFRAQHTWSRGSAAPPVVYNPVLGKGDVGESSGTASIKYLSSLLTGVQEQSSGTWRETSASLQHPHWNPTWSHQPGQARHILMCLIKEN